MPPCARGFIEQPSSPPCARVDVGVDVEVEVDVEVGVELGDEVGVALGLTVDDGVAVGSDVQIPSLPGLRHVLPVGHTL